MINAVANIAKVPRRPRPRASGDDLIRSAVRQALNESGYCRVSQLEFDVLDGVVVLAGVVPSFYMKQLAQEIVRRIDIVSGIDNTVEVERR